MINIMINWSKADDKIKKFNFIGQQKKGKVVSVYDGDTIKIVFPIYNNSTKLYKWTCRLSYIDTPEIRTKNLKEKELGIKARDVLRDKILNKMVIIKCGDFDKYGRLLVEVFIQDKEDSIFNIFKKCFNYKTNDLYSINNWLLENNYAKNYNGGKKESWNI